MEMGNGFGSLGAAQLQARLEAAQGERIQEATRALSAKAEKLASKPGATASQKDADYQKLVKVSRDFESIFLGYLLKSMRDTVPKSEFLGHSRESELFGSMRDEELAKNLSKAGGIGLAKLMVDQLKRQIDPKI
jgi:flagellar protein FlgJ